MGAGKKGWGYYPAGNEWLPLRCNNLGQLEVDLSNVDLGDLGDVNVPAPVGNDLLYWDAGAGRWQSRSVAVNLATLLTTRGDLLRRGAVVAERYGIGAAGTYLRANGVDPLWAVPTALELADTPAAYAGAALSGLRVNAAANAIEFAMMAAVTVAAVTLYVDTGGSDVAGDGSAGNPYATPNRATLHIRENFPIILHDVTIAINRGNYALAAEIDMSGILVLGTLTIESRDLAGVAMWDEGTATGGAPNALDDAGKAWPVNYWAGSYVAITRGACVGQYRQIASNTGTRLVPTVNFAPGVAAGSKYTIASAVLTGGGALNHAVDAAAINNVRMHGLLLTNFLDYAARFRGCYESHFYWNIVDCWAGRGVQIEGGRAEIRGSLGYVSAYGLTVGSSCYAMLQDNCLIRNGALGVNRGLYVGYQGNVGFGGPAGSNTFFNWATGVTCAYGGLAAVTSVQTYIGCVANWAPIGNPDPSYAP